MPLFFGHNCRFLGDRRNYTDKGLDVEKKKVYLEEKEEPLKSVKLVVIGSKSFISRLWSLAQYLLGLGST